MGLLQRMTGWMSRTPAGDGVHAARAASNGRIAPLAEPVAIDLDPIPAQQSVALVEAKVAAPAWTRQELVSELRRNYVEVVDIVRRVETRLEQAEARGARLAELAERIAESNNVLPTLCAQNAELIESAQQMVESSRSGADRLDASLARLQSVAERHLAAGEGVAQGFETAAKAQSELTSAVGVFRAAVAQMSQDAAHRDDRVLGLLDAGRRWIIVSIATAAGAIVTAAAAVVLLVMRG